MGKGRWDAQSLAEELECSKRTVHRLLQALTAAGVPWYFDEGTHSYRVRSGFQMKGLDLDSQTVGTNNQRALKQSAQTVLKNIQQLRESLQKLVETLDEKTDD
jgi:biotin operon repressor